MKKRLFNIILGLVIMMNICFFSAVNAANYEENTFTDGKCVTGTAWHSYVKTSYSLNQESGTYETSGNDYEEGNANIYYATSENGKRLYAFVPDYNNKKVSAKSELMEKAIDYIYDCSTTYIVNKTVIGNPISDDEKDESELDFESSDNNVEDGDDATERDQNSEVDETSDTNGAEENNNGAQKTERMDAANTASPAAVAGIILSLLLVGVGGYSFIKKYRPDLLKKVIRR